MMFNQTTRQNIRRAIADQLGILYIGTTTAAGQTNQLVDERLQGGQYDHKGKELFISDTELVTVSFDGDKTLTFRPDLSGAVGSGTEYEMYSEQIVTKLNRMIDQVVRDACQWYKLLYEDHSLIHEDYKYEYEIPSSFVAINLLEYVAYTDISKTLHNCDAEWDELQDGDATISVDSDDYKTGSGCNKFVIAAGMAAGDIIATDAITETDLTDCDEVVLWIKSSVDTTAGQLQLLLDNTASCASALETLDIPALTANEWTFCTISLASPEDDSAIISIGLKYTEDIGACTIRIDRVKGEHSLSRRYTMVPPNCWKINQASTPTIKLEPPAIRMIPDQRIMRLTGYKHPSVMTSDSDTTEVPPDYLKAEVLARLLLGKARSREKDKDDKGNRGTMWYKEARNLRESLRTRYLPNTRKVRQI